MSLSRRRFLSGSAAAGAGALLATRFPGLVERAYAATPTACAPLSDIEHVVFLMQENRSFDHYFGTYRGVRGFGDPAVLKQANGLSVFNQPGYAAGKSPDGHLLPYHLNTKDLSTYAECVNDISHEYVAQHVSWNGGKMDNWVVSHLQSDGATIGPLTMGYYDRADIPFYYDLADAFTLCDAYHCSIMGPTDPNRLYAMTGMIDPTGEFGGPILSTSSARVDRTSTLSWKTMPEVLQEAGISWKAYAPPDGYFFNPLPYFKQFNNPTSPLYEAAYPAQNFPAGFEADVLAATLPAVSWIFPSLVQSEHPAAPPEYGEMFVASALNALVANTAVWEKTALIVTYDENGGFFDHVPPPVPPAGTEGEWLTAAKLPTVPGGNAAEFRGPIGLGFRVPTLIISPYSRGGLVSSALFDHTSMLKFLETRFGVEAPNITPWRRATVGDLTAAFNFQAPAVNTVPSITQPSATDPAVLKECLPGALTGTEDAGPTYAVPANSMPSQEAGRAGVPSGLVCAAGSPAAVAPVPPTTAPVPAAGATSGSATPGATLPTTGISPAIPLAGAAVGAAAVAALRLRRSTPDGEGDAS